jgi:ribokinase
MAIINNHLLTREVFMGQSAILVVGSLNMDQIMRIPRIPVLGETLLSGSSLKFSPGGKGANQAVAMARLGYPVSMAGRVGLDPFGKQLLQSLQTNGIDTQLVVTDEAEPTGVALIFLTREGENAIIVASGANMAIGNDKQQLAQIFAALPQAKALVLQLEIPVETVKALIEAGYKAHIPVILNLAPAQPLPQETLKQLSVIILNENEASLLSGQRVSSIEDARIVATVLHEHGIPTVVITLGSLGAVLVTNDATGNARSFYQEAPKVQVVDTTAAGDSFVGALTGALSEGQPAPDALRFAVYASALTVTKLGAQPSLPTRQDVEELLKTK